MPVHPAAAKTCGPVPLACGPGAVHASLVFRLRVGVVHASSCLGSLPVARKVLRLTPTRPACLPLSPLAARYCGYPANSTGPHGWAHNVCTYDQSCVIARQTGQATVGSCDGGAAVQRFAFVR